MGAFGVGGGYYLDNSGKMKYGPVEQGYKDYLITVNKWYKEGLIAKDYTTMDGKVNETNIFSGKTIAFTGYGGSTMDSYLKNMKAQDPKFNIVAVPYVTLKKGEKLQFGDKALPTLGGYGYAISGQSKNIELAAKWLDFGYSEAGQLVYNF